MRSSLNILVLGLLAVPPGVRAELPGGYLVWSHGSLKDKASRRIWRMTLPGKTDRIQLTTGEGGEDVECQVSPDGQWVAFARAKLPNMDYHRFENWRLYVVSIHGTGDCREEIKIDDDGYWPSWGEPQGGHNVLYYSQMDDGGEGEQTRIMRVLLDASGDILDKTEYFSTRPVFSEVPIITECFLSPDGSWFAARTRGDDADGVMGFQIDPPEFALLAQAGSVGCMPVVAPSGEFALVAGRDHGIRFGEKPSKSDRVADEQLIPPRGADDLCYHPGISSDGEWVMAAHSTDNDHNAGPYDVYIYALDRDSMSVDAGELLAGGEFNGWPSLWVGQPGDPPPPSPRIAGFAPDVWTIVTGESVELSWQVACGESATLDGEPVDLEGSRIVSPTESTTYTLVAASTLVADTDTATVDITVNQTPQAVVIESFTAEPGTITEGDSAVLSWTVQNPTTLDVNGKAVTPSGSMEVVPLRTTEYVLTANGHEGPAVSTVTVTVEKQKVGLDDRGGCFCLTASLPEAVLLGIVLLGLIVARLRRRASR